MDVATILFLINSFFYVNGVTYEEQLEHITRKRLESLGIPEKTSRRLNVGLEEDLIIGAPTDPKHLPEAEAILPGHTLLRPARGMLKSAVKFPHRDLNNGAGVYGNYDNIGIRYDSKSDKVLYSGFRRNSIFLPEDSKEIIWFGDIKENHLRNNKKKDKQRFPYLILSRKPLKILSTSKSSKPQKYKNNKLLISNRHKALRVDSNRNDFDIKTEQEPWFWNSKSIFDHILMNPELTKKSSARMKRRRKRRKIRHSKKCVPEKPTWRYWKLNSEEE